MDNRTTSHDRVPAQPHAQNGIFLIEAARDIRTTGAIAPSSAALARTLTEPVRAQAGRPLDILEAGAGTGAVTRTLISQLPQGSHLDVAEANPRFTSRLHHLATTHPHLAGHGRRARIHTERVEDLDADRRYDVIVSGLPFANFAPDQVETIMDRYLELLRPGGTLTYFAYLGTRQAHTLLPSRNQARRRRAVEEILTGYQRRYATGCWRVWANLPPAEVWQLKHPLSAVPGPRPTAAGTGW
ncbi:methyltransferase domain-containing protein [Streptomyces sp. NBC_01795]|uniref:class I SAM-dependent methyltransferase n=1 Tax=unclassified Streptomyces TaxID=2593676 RepID=UPI002DD8829E|nr:MULTISPECIES: methyltransferase domain-containing protein [unclassified Streptomyces]WSA94620.1 methyltransferase domain-containing protein [Streptomyces sp. NBC_01795]WSB79040.1 methyltransferase domain-containing protein [Streptomyces sp. NBC_01775]